ncbi:polysaccharide deacetylase family protein [Tsukamurella sp. 1534]|uniref:polysaccharide deacetylase family protein n=1 Tax=Tsukamurella sp. 1534 TaxID=1151061 RepID=UPI00131EE7F5|nr:polysaccharide deacetylase family protein [Tsukamurella sp. 1534]
MRPNQSRKVRNYAVMGSAVVVAGAVAAACTLGGSSSNDAGSSLTFDPLPSSAPSGASAAPSAGVNPGKLPNGQPAATPAPPAPPTMTVVVPPPNAPKPAAGAPTVPAGPAAPPTPAAGGAPSNGGGQQDGAPSNERPAPSSSAAPSQVSKPVMLADGTVDCAKSKCVALTFSGGPGPATRQFLQTLDAHDAHGTFFVTGAQVNLNPDIMTAIAGTGNEVGNGTWTQPDMTTLSDAEGTDQLQRTNEAIRNSVGTTPTLFRPMGGHTSPAVVDAGKRLGLSQILWDLDSRDYAYQGDPDGLTKVLLQAKPGQIVMLHDTFEASATALDRTLTELEKQGYAFVTVSQLLRSRSAG